MKFLFGFLFLIPAAYASDCSSLYDSRHINQAAAESAYHCYELSLTSAQSSVDKARIEQKMSYLQFYMAEFYLNQNLDSFLNAISLGEKAILNFGPKYSLEAYAHLDSTSLDVLAESLYTYGLSISRYVDLKGKIEAIKRMEDIKKSMNTILRIKRESVVYFGAYRTLGIFNLKVPAIAGGQIQLSRPYLEKAIQGTLYRGSLSRYPGNNSVHAEVLFKSGLANDACAELKEVIALTSSDVNSLDNGMIRETMNDIAHARDLYSERACH